MSTKVIMAVASIILVVGVVAGAIATVYRNRKDDTDLYKKINIVSNFCLSTPYQESCWRTLSSVNSTNPKEFIAKAILAAEEATNKFFNYSDSLSIQAEKNSLTKMALDDCKDMMNYAIDSFKASYSSVYDAGLHNINDGINDLRTWLSAGISYQQSCLDGFEDNNDMKEIMQMGIIDASELTRNALTIVTNLQKILSRFGFQFNIANTRKLLPIEKNSYPPWFSTKDRQLLTKIDNNNLKPNAIVAKDGNGQFNTIGAALAAAPKNSNVRHVIYIKAGIYNEYIIVDKQYTNILVYGDGPRKTIVTGRKGVKDGGGITTWQTATFCKFTRTQTILFLLN